MDGEELAVVAATEAEAVGSAETEEHVQRILLAIDNFTHKVSEMLDSERAMFKDLAADFEDCLCTIHKERVEKWEEEIRSPQCPAPALPHPDALDFIRATEDKRFMSNQGAWCSQAMNGGCSTSATLTTTASSSLSSATTVLY